MEDAYERLVEQVRGTVGAPLAWVSGVPVFRIETNTRTREELGVFVPVTIAVMTLLLFATLRTGRAVVVPLTVSGTSVCLLGGLMGWIGIPLSAPTMILPPVLLAIGCAYAMHLLTEVDHLEGADELVSGVTEVARPIALSGLTTAIGFASTAVVPIEAVQRVGILGALGTAIACAATLGLGAAIISIWPGDRVPCRLVSWLRGQVALVLITRIGTHSSRMIAAWIVIFCLGVFGAQRLIVESDVVIWFPRGSEVRDAYEAIKAELSGISPINIVIKASGGRSVAEPDVVDAIARLGDYLSAVPEVGKVLSVADPIRELHEGFSGEGSGALPSDRDSIEQYLLLLEGTERLSDVITADRTAANILLRIDENGSRRLLRVARDAEVWWAENGVEGYEARGTGIMFEVARSEDAIALGQIQGLGLDVLTIAIVLLVALRSLRLAIVALLPNVLPLGLMFGFMGLTRIPLDLGTVFVSSLAVGIAIDETIHLVSAFGRMKARGATNEEALRIAMQKVVPALVLTTLIIGAGFAVLTLSEFRFTRNLGLLTTGVMVLCVASNITLLPALILRFVGERSVIPAGGGAP
jgi:predicted RND superfamily exporter protein